MVVTIVGFPNAAIGEIDATRTFGTGVDAHALKVSAARTGNIFLKNEVLISIKEPLVNDVNIGIVSLDSLNVNTINFMVQKRKTPALSVRKLVHEKLPYHHGDLRNALIDAAVATMAAQGDVHFSLSEIARGAGVTPAAAYKHFADKQALLHALARLGFDRLATVFETATPRSKTANSVVQVRKNFARLGSAYVAFGVAQPALFNLMFGRAGQSFRKQATVANEQTATFAYLVRTLDDLHRLGVIRAPSAQDQWFAWSAIHGATELTIAGITSMVNEQSAAEVVTGRVIQALSL